MRTRLAIAALLLLGASAIYADPQSASLLSTLTYAVSQLCISLKSMLPVVAMMMLILAGVIYASGQILGAETRARANVWATAALTGALMAILIAVVAPAVLQMIYDSNASSSTAGTNIIQC